MDRRKGTGMLELRLDAMELAETSDVIVIASGDGDFDLLVKRIQQVVMEKQLEVYGVPGLTANSLIEAADRYQAIEASLLL